MHICWLWKQKWNKQKKKTENGFIHTGKTHAHICFVTIVNRHIAMFTYLFWYTFRYIALVVLYFAIWILSVSGDEFEREAGIFYVYYCIFICRLNWSFFNTVSIISFIFKRKLRTKTPENKYDGVRSTPGVKQEMRYTSFLISSSVA